jgi:hypothetical protein
MFDPEAWDPSGLAAAEMAESGQRREERDQRGQRQESLHLHSLHLLLEVEVLQCLGRAAVELRRPAIVPPTRRKVSLSHPGCGAVTG